MPTDKNKTNDTSTEAKIKTAARVVFHKKGFAATRTRDIAEEAGINLALLNYYFRSKAKLFEIIMLETLSGFIQNIIAVLNDEQTTMEAKVTDITTKYINILISEPEIPTFIVAEIRSNPSLLLNTLPVRQALTNSVFVKQYQEVAIKNKIVDPNPLHFFMNLLGLIVFPFIAKPLLMGGTDITEGKFNQIMRSRQRMIPVWINAIIKAK